MAKHRAATWIVSGAIITILLVGARSIPARAAPLPAPAARAAPAPLAAAVTETNKATLPETSIAGPGFAAGAAIAWTGTDAAHHLNIRTGTDGLTEGVRRKPCRLSGSGEADLRGLSLKSCCLSDSACLCQNTWSDTFAPHQLNTVCRFRGKSFPRVKAVTSLGRGALRLSGGCFELTTPHRDGVNVQWAGAPPSGAKQQLWNKQGIRLLA